MKGQLPFSISKEVKDVLTRKRMFELRKRSIGDIHECLDEIHRLKNILEICEEKFKELGDYEMARRCEEAAK